ncbi:MAG: hypothetical protein ACAH83_07605 [Alphaproteobacteria bacterium]
MSSGTLESKELKDLGLELKDLDKLPAGYEPHDTPAGFEDLIATLCWAYVLAYCIVIGVRFYKARRAGNIRAAMTGGTWNLVFASACLLVFSFAQKQTLPWHGLPIPARITLNILALAAPFYPWVMMMRAKNDPLLQRQGRKGLSWAVGAPLLLFFVMFLVLLYTEYLRPRL